LWTNRPDNDFDIENKTVSFVDAIVFTHLVTVQVAAKAQSHKDRPARHLPAIASRSGEAGGSAALQALAGGYGFALLSENEKCIAKKRHILRCLATKPALA